MTAQKIDGKEIAAALRGRIGTAVRICKTDIGKTPGLAVVLVGEDAASQVYVKNKGIATKEAGMTSLEFRLPADTPEEVLLGKLRELNADPEVNGILVQFPCPRKFRNKKSLIRLMRRKMSMASIRPMPVVWCQGWMR